MSLTKSECPLCGRLHEGADFTSGRDLARKFDLAVEVLDWLREQTHLIEQQIVEVPLFVNTPELLFVAKDALNAKSNQLSRLSADLHTLAERLRQQDEARGVFASRNKA